MHRRHERSALHLPPHGIHYFGMTMSESGHKDSANCIEVAFAFRVPIVKTVGALMTRGFSIKSAVGR